MALPLPNRILREIVDIQCFGEAGSLTARSEVDRLCGERLTRALDELLGAWGVPDDQLIFIDRLQVEVPAVSSRDLEAQLIPRIIDALRTELARKVGNPGSLKAGAIRPLRLSLLDQLRFFLQRGYLPWSIKDGQEWAAAIGELLGRLDPSETQQLIETLQLPEARFRMVRHFPEATLSSLVPVLPADDELKALFCDIQMIAREMPFGSDFQTAKEHFIHLLLETAMAGRVQDECRIELESMIRHWVSEQLLPMPIFEQASSRTIREIVTSIRAEIELLGSRALALARPKEKNPLRRGFPTVGNRTPGTAGNVSDNDKQDRDPIYIANGGLVIAAPYLPALFQKLGLLDEGQLRDTATALPLLHYLVFGSDECAEWDFVLGKILCGIPLQQPIATPQPLSDIQKAEVNLLLEAIIKNWPALKNSSPDALRATFLQREGALTRENDHWRLRLTRTAFDVLVDRLPWTISMIQLPWMRWLLRTDWAD